MYNFENAKASTSPFPVSCHVDNVTLDRCEYVSQSNWEAIDFYYKREGSTLKDRIFAAKIENTKPRPYIPNDTAADALAAKDAIMLSQLKQIATKFGITNEQILALGNLKDFKTLAMQYCNMVNSKCKGVKLYCKTIVDDGGFTKIARGNNTIPFLQRMDSGDCELSYTVNELAKSEIHGRVKNGVTEKSESWTKEKV